VQDVALAEDQVRVAELPVSTVVLEAVSVALGSGAVGAEPALLPALPPQPPRVDSAAAAQNEVMKRMGFRG